MDWVPFPSKDWVHGYTIQLFTTFWPWHMPFVVWRCLNCVHLKTCFWVFLYKFCGQLGIPPGQDWSHLKSFDPNIQGSRLTVPFAFPINGLVFSEHFNQKAPYFMGKSKRFPIQISPKPIHLTQASPTLAKSQSISRLPGLSPFAVWKASRRWVVYPNDETTSQAAVVFFCTLCFWYFC